MEFNVLKALHRTIRKVITVSINHRFNVVYTLLPAGAVNLGQT